MTTVTYELTSEQQRLLDQNPQHHAVSFLDDGDLVICEDGGTIPDGQGGTELSLWAVWCLTRDGKIHTLAHHYKQYHYWAEEQPGRQAAPAEPQAVPAEPHLLDMEMATSYLFRKYRTLVSERTVRNWLNDGRLAGGRLGLRERAPWYTTTDALDLAATREWFPAPEPTPLEHDVDARVGPTGSLVPLYPGAVVDNEQNQEDPDGLATDAPVPPAEA